MTIYTRCPNCEALVEPLTSHHPIENGRCEVGDPITQHFLYWSGAAKVDSTSQAVCPRCGSQEVTAHIQTVVPGSVGSKVSVSSVGWRCLKCQNIWGHEGFAEKVLGYK